MWRGEWVQHVTGGMGAACYGAWGGKGVQARLLGQLNGDLTRLRQTACHASVVNEARAGAGGRRERVHAADGSRLAQAVVVARGAGAATREQRVPTTGSGT